MSHVIDHGMPFEEAVAAPRLHVEPKLARFGFLILEAEERFEWPDSEVTQFRLLGFKVGPREPILGEICGIHIDPTTGILTGVADPRGSGWPVARAAARHHLGEAVDDETAAFPEPIVPVTQAAAADGVKDEVDSVPVREAIDRRPDPVGE